MYTTFNLFYKKKLYNFYKHLMDSSPPNIFFCHDLLTPVSFQSQQNNILTFIVLTKNT